MTINPNDFVVQVQLKKPDGTHSIKQWSFKGLFDAEAKSLGLFDALVKKLTPEALEKPVMIQVLHNFKTLNQFTTKSWGQ